MIAFLAGSAAFAKSWCAAPVVAHEWGVLELSAGGDVVAPAALPPWFGRSGVVVPSAGRVRDLPADSGIRLLPVVQFYRGDTRSGPVPLGVTVGFAQGTATAWFPPVDAVSLHSGEAQLTWDALRLDDAPAGALGPVGASEWIARLRDTPNALWVDRGAASERFLFYEGRTREASSVVATREGGQWVVQNRSDWPVHEVSLVRGGARGRVGTLAPGERRQVVLDAGVGKAWRDEVRAAWVGAEPARSTAATGGEGCVMGRDPAQATERATGHTLYAPEVDVLLSVWGERLFSSADHLVYREDPAALDVVMPVSLYTDMYHWLDWHRLGVVLVDGEEP